MDNRLKKINIQIPDNWKDISDSNPNGPPTFIDIIIGNSNILQISLAEYLSGKIPAPKLVDLVNLSRNIGLRNGLNEPLNEESGNCDYGIFGYAQFADKAFPHIAFWHLSDGKNFVFASFICSQIPTQEQLYDVNRIIKSVKGRTAFFHLS